MANSPFSYTKETPGAFERDYLCLVSEGGNTIWEGNRADLNATDLIVLGVSHLEELLNTQQHPSSFRLFTRRGDPVTELPKDESVFVLKNIKGRFEEPQKKSQPDNIVGKTGMEQPVNNQKKPGVKSHKRKTSSAPTPVAPEKQGIKLKNQLFSKIATEKKPLVEIYKFNPNDWKDVSYVDAVALMFTKFCEYSFCEIEASIGRWENGHFTPGLHKHDFDRILNMLNSYQKWSNGDASKKWNVIIDYFLFDHIRVSKTSSGNEFVRKTLIDNITFKCPERPYDMRVSLKVEAPVEVSLPKEPSFVRVKKRRSFVYKDRWRFDCSCVWSGVDEQDAQSRPPVYEVECEFLVKDKRDVRQNVKYNASDLIEKVVDFLGRQTPTSFIIQHATFSPL